MQSPAPSRPPRVFVSYSHDSKEHADQVLALCNRLRADGIDARLDQYESSPPEGWPRWCARQLQQADFVLVVCTKAYESRFRAEESGSGLGVAWEGHIITQELYGAGGRNTKFIPILLSPVDLQHVPAVLQGTTHYRLDPDGAGYRRLYRHLTGQPEVSAPPLGARVSLPARERQLAFAPAPRFKDESSRRLAEARETAQRQLEELTLSGQDTRAVREELLRLRREMREGGRLLAGDYLAEGRFRLIEPVGQGGFATVWKAYDRLRCSLVAVKVLHSFYSDDRTRRERFFRGARRMAELRHPGIATVIEPCLEEGVHSYFVLEYVRGGDLRQAVLAGRLSQEEALAVIARVGEALAYAHGQGVFHRDVKPANILLDENRHPKLTDFDLVRALDTTGGTRSQDMLGTFVYAAPELLHGADKAGVAAEVFALAMTTIFVLHGKELPPLIYQTPSPLVRTLPCPPAAQQLLLRAISWRPAERPRSIARFCQELLQASKEPESLTRPAPDLDLMDATDRMRYWLHKTVQPAVPAPEKAPAGVPSPAVQTPPVQGEGSRPGSSLPAPAEDARRDGPSPRVKPVWATTMKGERSLRVLRISAGLLLAALALVPLLYAELFGRLLRVPPDPASLSVLLLEACVCYGAYQLLGERRRNWLDARMAGLARWMADQMFLWRLARERRVHERVRRKVITKHLQRVTEEKQLKKQEEHQ